MMESVVAPLSKTKLLLVVVKVHEFAERRERFVSARRPRGKKGPLGTLIFDEPL